MYPFKTFVSLLSGQASYKRTNVGNLSLLTPFKYGDHYFCNNLTYQSINMHLTSANISYRFSDSLNTYEIMLPKNCFFRASLF